jgi:hypothetical protein
MFACGVPHVHPDVAITHQDAGFLKAYPLSALSQLQPLAPTWSKYFCVQSCIGVIFNQIHLLLLFLAQIMFIDKTNAAT